MKLTLVDLLHVWFILQLSIESLRTTAAHFYYVSGIILSICEILGRKSQGKLGAQQRVVKDNVVFKQSTFSQR